jgi:hypothetical protein
MIARGFRRAVREIAYGVAQAPEQSERLRRAQEFSRSRCGFG